MSIEKIRTVFRNAGLYCAAADDLLCQALAAASQPHGIVDVPNILARTNERQEVEVYWHGNLFAVVPPVRVAAPKPQASAEDVALVDRAMRGPIYNGSPQRDAWQRIRASLGVGK